jgi:hypothetical protein
MDPLPYILSSQSTPKQAREVDAIADLVRFLEEAPLRRLPEPPTARRRNSRQRSEARRR